MPTVGDVHVVELQLLKAEQNSRISTRDNLIFAALTAIAVVGWAALTINQWDLLLAGGGGVLQIGWVFFANDRKIAWTRSYVKGRLRDNLARATSPGAIQPADLLGWESQPRYWGLTFYRLGGLWFDLGLFVLPAAAAETWWITNRWDGATTNPLLWAWGYLVASTAMVAVAAVASTLNRRPIDAGGTR